MTIDSPAKSIGGENGGLSSWHFLVTVIYFAFSFVFVRFLLDKFIFSNLSVCILPNSDVRLKLKGAKEAKIVKCSESMWKFTYYTATEIFIIKSIYKEPWFTDTQEFFNGWPNQELKVPVELYYICQCGFYTYSIFALLFWETRRKDFLVTMSHHIITVILIGFSYLTRFFRIGTVILCLHDASDIFMEAAKVFNYSENELAANVLFGCFAVSWLVLRLVFFPFWVIKSSSYDSIKIMNLEDSSHRFIYYTFNTMLLMLLNFHIYWWSLICAMITRQLRNRGQLGQDVRSDSEDED